MSARRQAKATRARPPTRASEGVPLCLKVGACIEVWAPTSGDRDPLLAYRRHRETRRWWLERAGVTETKHACELLPLGAPWSVEYLTYRGQAERVGRTVAEIVRDRLAAVGCTLADLPELHAEAQELHALAHRQQLKESRT